MMKTLVGAPDFKPQDWRRTMPMWAIILMDLLRSGWRENFVQVHTVWSESFGIVADVQIGEDFYCLAKW